MVHEGTREGGCASPRGTCWVLPPGTEGARGTLAGSQRWGIHGPGHECKEVQVESRSQGQARDTPAGDAESLVLE